MKHGATGTRLYSIWKTMKKRCSYEKAVDYQYYGGRGIRVCDEWSQNFTSFRNWALSHGYADDLTIDRIDSDGDYCPENCRWVDMATQARNRRPNVTDSSRIISLTIGHTTKSLKFWSELTGIRYDTLYHRAQRSSSLDVLFDPESRIRFYGKRKED